MEPLNKLMQQNFRGSLAFKISRLAREVNKEYETFNGARAKLIEKYAMREEDGNYALNENGDIKIEPDKIKECNDDFEVLLDSSIEINVDKFPIDSIDEFNITPQEMDGLMVFFEE